MPNHIERVDNRSPKDYFVNPASRYAEATVIYYGNQKMLTYETYKRTFVKASPKDMYTVVSPGWEYRPDLVSQKMYGVPDFWYKIMEANKIYDIMDFKTGLNIRLPEMVL